MWAVFFSYTTPMCIGDNASIVSASIKLEDTPEKQDWNLTSFSIDARVN